MLHRLEAPVKPLGRTLKNIANKKPRHRYAVLYGSVAWQNLRSSQLQDEPLCAKCDALATEVDHIQPHNGDSKLFHDPGNLQSLCRPCHQHKTRKGL